MGSGLCFHLGSLPHKLQLRSVHSCPRNCLHSYRILNLKDVEYAGSVTPISSPSVTKSFIFLSRFRARMSFRGPAYAYRFFSFVLMDGLLSCVSGLSARFSMNSFSVISGLMYRSRARVPQTGQSSFFS